ncbi:aminotransferase class I/II-fold pyridoxal phosphate-dependent enzyme [Bacillus sp. HNG]|uniref:aminotransferase class I/II-fold pyridoxal phosphate-dependent enzyme n=1 Tax=Bacillus sp. HNG TaxID=2293325 RepID=UPI000E2ED228|nr:aminotransferase class I/II-fold pyridoxal phosphate-dependent enzyme [Bacillus sp. HNG]RFB13640.1 aminotransferase class I/II-fold pyridoxal phosphate-dependent enzyme [Bacillus sp. HNG]
MNEIARNLNELIKSHNQSIFEMLSDFGRKAYYPKGILSQSAEANEKATRFNATIGIATEHDEPMHFSHIQKRLNGLLPKDIYQYAPPSGRIELRNEWYKKLLHNNPSLENKNINLPIVTTGITHGLSIVADLFINENDSIILPDKYWGNYQSIFCLQRGGSLKAFELFDKDGKFNVSGFRERLMEQKVSGKAIVLLNFPNNPTGYTPYEDEASGIISTLVEAADLGINIVLIIDDAYFGLFYEDSISESLFGRVAGLHKRILPIKVDGATKESFVWGLRVGFITFACEVPILEILEHKVEGVIRSSISSSSILSQSIILDSLRSDEYKLEKREKYEIMKRRALKVKDILTKEKYKEVWSIYPFNSGYFMCLKLLNVNAEELRVHLLDRYGVGTVSINPTDLRIAFSSVEEEDLEKIFEYIYQGVDDLKVKHLKPILQQ